MSPKNCDTGPTKSFEFNGIPEDAISRAFRDDGLTYGRQPLLTRSDLRSNGSPHKSTHRHSPSH